MANEILPSPETQEGERLGGFYKIAFTKISSKRTGRFFADPLRR